MLKKLKSLIPVFGVLSLVLFVSKSVFAETPCWGIDYNSTFLLQMRVYMQAPCWFCDIFGTMFDAINALATTLFAGLGSMFLSLLGVGILFIILFKVGRMLVQLQEVDVMQFLNDLFKPLGRAIIAMAFLVAATLGTDNIFTTVINPFLDLSMYMSTEVLESSLDNVEMIRVYGGRIERVGVNLEAYRGEVSSTDDTDKALKNETKANLLLFLNTISTSFMVGIAGGSALMNEGIIGIFSGGLYVFFVGMAMWLSYFILYLFFPFKLVDSFVRIGFVLALMPLWITLWAFPSTAGYTKKAWEMFLSSCLFFIIISVMVSMGLMLMNEAIPNGPTRIRENFFKCLMADRTNAAMTWLNFGSGAFLNMLSFAMMAGTLMSAAAPLANTFVSGGGDLNIGNGMASSATRALSVTKNVAKTTVGAARAGAGWALGKMGSNGRTLPTKLNKIADALNTPLSGNMKDDYRRIKDIFSKPDGGSGSMDDFNRLTDDGKRTVSSRGSDMFSKLQTLANNKDRKGMESIIEAAKTPAERQALIAASEQLLRKGGKGQIDEKTTRALMNEYARQEIAKNPRLTKEGAYADEMTKRKLADEKQHNKDAKKSLADRKAAIPGLAKKQIDEFGRADDKKQADMIKNAKSDREAELLQKARAEIQSTGSISRDTTELLQREKEKNMSETLAKFDRPELHSDEEKIFKENLAYTQGRSNVPDVKFEDEKVTSVAKNDAAKNGMDGFIQDVLKLEELASYKNKDEAKKLAKEHTWSTGSTDEMVRNLERMQMTAGKPISYGMVSRDLVNDYLLKNGVSGTDARNLGKTVSDTIARGDIDRLSAAIQDLKNKIDNKA